MGAKLLQCLDHVHREIDWRDARVEKLTFKMAQLKRVKFGKKSEQPNAEQKALFAEALDADIAALEDQLEELLAAAKTPSDTSAPPKRTALPVSLLGVERHHKPESTTCTCGCTLQRIGEDVSEKLDYAPDVFTVERHIRGKWACTRCRALTQATVPAEIIDKGIPTSGLLCQVLVAEYADHLPLYRQEQIFARAGLALPRSTLLAWAGVCGVRLQPLVDALKAQVLGCVVVHADETPGAMWRRGPARRTARTLGLRQWRLRGVACGGLRIHRSRAGEHARALP